MNVGDLVREKGLQERTGIIVGEINSGRMLPPRGRSRLFKVLWNEWSPTSPTLICATYAIQLEVINESR